MPDLSPSVTNSLVLALPAALTACVGLANVLVGRRSSREQVLEQRLDADATETRKGLAACRQECNDWRDRYLAEREKGVLRDARIERLTLERDTALANRPTERAPPTA